MSKILIVDDDSHIREVVRFAMAQAGHQVCEARDGSEALQLFERQSPDLVILDVIMPEQDGLEVCRKIREQSDTPILFLSSRDEEIDRVLGLELGADDYITKPFSPRELTARVKANLRRVSGAKVGAENKSSGRIDYAGLCLDPEQHSCHVHQQSLNLTVTEFNLLYTLMKNPGRVYGRNDLMDLAMGEHRHVSDRTVDSHIRRLRKKLQDAKAEDLVETVFGVGYRLRAR